MMARLKTGVSGHALPRDLWVRVLLICVAFDLHLICVAYRAIDWGMMARLKTGVSGHALPRDLWVRVLLICVAFDLPCL
jgi:hypothetical protein